MKRNFTFLMVAFALIVSMMMPLGMKGENRGVTTYTFTSKVWKADPADWTSGKDGNQMTSGRGVQVTTGVSGANATSPVSFSDVSKVEITYSTNSSSGAGSVVVQIGSNTSVSKTVTSSGGTSDRVLTFNYSEAQTGTVKFTVNCTTNSIYIKSISITHNSSSGGATTTVDVLNRDFTGITNTTYSDWTGTGASGTVYSGNSAGGNSSIQLRSSSLSGIVSTTSFGKVTNVVVTWNSNTAADRTLDIYGKNTAYTDASDLYNNSTRGTKLGSIVKGTSTTLDITGDYDYIGLRSNSGAMYLSEIQITWEVQAANPVATPTFSPAAGTYTEPQSVTLSCTTSGATIYYTTDGLTPNTSSSVYSSAIPVSANTTIKAIAVKEGVSSEVATASYVFVNPATKTATYTITSTTSVSAAGTVPSGSSASFVNTYTNNKVQLTAGKSMTLTLSGYQGKVITGVVLSMHSNSSKGAGSLSITAGSSSLASISGNFKPNWYSEWTTEFVDVNVPMTDDDYGIQSGEQLVITIEATTNSLYCQSFTIQYEDDVNPRIIVTAPGTLAYEATSGAFNYSISNPVQGTSLQASSNADWISDIQVGDSQVTFTTTVNDTYLERNDTITLTYGTKTKDVIITQAALVPVITFSDAPTDAFPYEGDNGSFSFSIDHFVDGAIASAYSAEYWIRNFEVSDDMVYFEVAPSIEDARSGNITLSYMLNGATLASVTVPINQETNPNEHGSFERPYNVSEAWAIINHMADGVTADNSVYVAGTISQIEQVEVIQYHNATYYITDGNKTVKVQYGRNLDDTDFYDEDEIQVGDRVVVYGRLMKYNANTYEIAPYNYLVSLERDVEPPLFIPTSCMMANDENALVYLYTNNGNEEEIVIRYTLDGSTPSPTSPKYCDEDMISLENVLGTVTINAIAYDTVNRQQSAMNSATYKMVAPHTPGLLDNPLTVQQALEALTPSSNTLSGVYVSGIVSSIPEISLSNFMNANYHIADNLGDDSQLYVYHGRSLHGQPFQSEDDLQYGDIVTVYGDLTIYTQNGVSIKEFKAQNYLTELHRPTSVYIRPFEVSTNCRGISGSLTVVYNNLTHIYSSQLQFYDAQGNQVQASTYDWLAANWNSSTGNIDFQIEDNDSNAPRTAYLKLVVVDNGNTLETNVVPITQAICSDNDFATLSFHYVGNESEVPAGITSNGLAENYQSSPYLKFDDVNDYMTLAFDEEPGELTFDITGDRFRSSEFYLQTSPNNLDWDDVAIYTTQEMINSWASDNPKREIARVIGSSMAQSFTELNENVRYIRWIMMTHSSDSKVRLGNIHLAKPLSPCTYAYSVNGTIGEPNEVVVGTVIEQMPSSNNIVINDQAFTFLGWTTDANNVENVMSAGTSYRLSRNVTFYAVYAETVAGSVAVKHYARVTSDLEANWAGDYLIAYSSSIFADGRIGGTSSNGIGQSGVSVDPEDNLHDNMVETLWGDVYHVTLEEVSPGSNTYLLKTQDGKYNYHTNNTSNGLTATDTRELAMNYPITVNFESVDDIRLSLGGNAAGSVFRYNPDGFFRFYKNGGQEPVYLYKKTVNVANRYTRVFVDNPTGSLTIVGPSIIPNGSVLNVASITNTLGADKLVIEEGAQLVTSSDVNATIKRFINPYQGDSDNYYLIASPVNNLNPATAGMTSANFDLYAFDQEAQGEEWQNYKADNFNLAAGQGYLYANDNGGFINMGGIMAATADDVTITEFNGKPFGGWNLIGNPYPCNVTINKPFYRLAEGGAVLATEATDNTVAIAPMEGVFVYADGTETVSFAKAPTTSTTGGRNLLSMRVSRNCDTKGGRLVEDNAIVRFGEGGLLRKLVLNPDLSQLYVAQDGIDYAIVNAEAEGELPVSFRAATNGSYTLSVAAEGVGFNYLHLVDNMNGNDVDLLQTPYYTFEAKTGDYESRFRLVFSVGTPTDDEAFAYYNGSQWVVNSDGATTLQVIDVMGRVLSSQSINGDAEVSIDRAAGVYLLRLMKGDDVKVQKIIIQ